jgi:hypothetical protein
MTRLVVCYCEGAELPHPPRLCAAIRQREVSARGIDPNKRPWSARGSQLLRAVAREATVKRWTEGAPMIPMRARVCECDDDGCRGECVRSRPIAADFSRTGGPMDTPPCFSLPLADPQRSGTDDHDV